LNSQRQQTLSRVRSRENLSSSLYIQRVVRARALFFCVCFCVCVCSFIRFDEGERKRVVTRIFRKKKKNNKHAMSWDLLKTGNPPFTRHERDKNFQKRVRFSAQKWSNNTLSFLSCVVTFSFLLLLLLSLLLLALCSFQKSSAFNLEDMRNK